MKKVIKLTESDLIKIVKKIINEEELSLPTNMKNCVLQIRKLYAANGFIERGVYGDGAMHDMDLSYERTLKGKTGPERVRISLTDYLEGDFFMINVDIEGAEKIINKQNHRGTSELDPKVVELFTKRYKVGSMNDSDMKQFSSQPLNCETAKTEIQKNIKPVEQELIRMGYKKVTR